MILFQVNGKKKRKKKKEKKNENKLIYNCKCVNNMKMNDLQHYKITFAILLWILHPFTVVYWDSILLLINLFLLKAILIK